MGDLVILHDRGRNRVHRLLCDSADDDAAHERLLAATDFVVARQWSTRQGGPKRHVGIDQPASSDIAQYDVGTYIITHLGRLAVERFVIAGFEGARQGEGLQGGLQAGEIAIDRERQLTGIVQELLVDARDFRVVVALQQNGGEYGSGDRDRKYEQQQVSPHGDAAYARTNVDQISPRAGLALGKI